MRTKVLDVNKRFGKEYAGRYVFQEITWARRSRIIQKHTRYHPITGQVVSSDFVAIQAETIWASLRKQPSNKPITLEKLLGEEDGIPVELGELFSRAANRLCGITPDEQCFLSERFDEEDRIQHSQTSASARNSQSRRSNSGNSQPEQLSSSS